MFPQNTDVFKMSLSAILNLTLWQRCANGLLGKHVSAMYITNMRNVRFLSELSSFCQQKTPNHLPTPPPYLEVFLNVIWDVLSK